MADFAQDLSVAYGTAKAMRRRGSIPSQYWLAVVSAASERSIVGINLQVLAEAVAIPPIDMKSSDAPASAMAEVQSPPQGTSATHSSSVPPLSRETGTLAARVFEESAATHSPETAR